MNAASSPSSALSNLQALGVRIGNLEAGVNRVESLIRREIDELKGEQRQEIADLKGEQIKDVRDHLTNAQNEIAGFRAQITALFQANATLHLKVATLEAESAANRRTIDSHEQRLAEFRGGMTVLHWVWIVGAAGAGYAFSWLSRMPWASVPKSP